MYHAYIDESGDDGNYLDKNGNVIEGSSRYFVLAGLIVSEADVDVFNSEYHGLIFKYFSGIRLPENFKLHCYPLRNNKFPYNHLSDTRRQQLEMEVFDIIKRLDCALVSVTVDIFRHCTKYKKPANPRSYALLLMLERFQYFLEVNKSHGVAIYERFNSKMRKRAMIESRWLQSHSTFPTIRLDNISRRVRDGDPTKEPILNLADFFADQVFAQRIKRRRYSYLESIAHKYFNKDGSWRRTGQVEI